MGTLKDAVTAAFSRIGGNGSGSSAIRVQAEEALAILNKLEATASECRAKAKKANQISAALQSVWQGSSGSAMSQSMANWARQQNAIADDLEAQIAAMRNAINAFIESDKALASRISGR